MGRTQWPLNSVGHFIATGGRVGWSCDAYGHYGYVDLQAVADAKGMDFSLANRKPRCRQPGCPGRVTFKDQTTVWGSKLDTVRDASDAYWDYSDRRAAELEALGFTMEMGRWKPPKK